MDIVTMSNMDPGGFFGVLLTESYHDGQEMSWTHDNVTKETPFVSDILQGLIKQYQVEDFSVQAQSTLMGKASKLHEQIRDTFETRYCKDLLLEQKDENRLLLSDNDLLELSEDAEIKL